MVSWLGMLLMPVIGLGMSVYGFCFARSGSRARCFKPFLLGLGALAVALLSLAAGFAPVLLLRNGDPFQIVLWMVLLLLVDAYLIRLYRSYRKWLQKRNAPEMETI